MNTPSLLNSPSSSRLREWRNLLGVVTVISFVLTLSWLPVFSWLSVDFEFLTVIGSLVFPFVLIPFIVVAVWVAHKDDITFKEEHGTRSYKATAVLLSSLFLALLAGLYYIVTILIAGAL